MLKEQGMTVREAMGLEPLKTSKVIAGSEGVDRVIVRLNIMADHEGIDWVSEGELLITTSLALKAKPDLSKDLIAKLHNKGLAALALKIGGLDMPISRELIAAADKYSFPLIELDPNVPFAYITDNLSSHIFNKQTALIMRMENIHNNLMNVVLSGGGLQDIAAVLYETIGNPIVIWDNIFGGCVGDDGSQDSSLLNGNLFSIVYNDDKTKNLSQDGIKKLTNYADNVNGRIVKRVLFPIMVSENIYGYVFLWEMLKPIGTIDYRTLETASAVIALEIIKRMSVYQVESRYKMEFLENLLSRDTTMQNLAFERGSFFDWSEKDGHTVMIVSIESREKIPAHKQMTPREIFAQYKNSIIQDIDEIVKKENEKAIIGEKSDSIIILLRSGEARDIEEMGRKARRIGDKIIKAVDQKYQKTKVNIGIGRHCTNVRLLWKSYQEARKAMLLGNSYGKKAMHFDDIGVYKILSQDNIKNELAAFYENTILPLYEYDKTRNTEFIATLKAYFEHNGNIRKMAEALYTHYNTVLYRLERIKEISNIDLKSPESRLNAEIGLKIMKIIEGNGSRFQ
ncbi:PucR family transcriptional regulator [Lutispora saccharofermentans]|uniref:PucR family transcriptional regulator ligand-binding domain-containing protein n=1 Tax=Lutispora saccharofermentans TaxID=3024236 RepID=A0ABT1NJN8_9FIRM|nr:PucR family transcriptional regulator [Lutispora saccharofermentans]MCQ1531490.1 PucR family transcriptional regulator ligand-binding domain-containing protein [Lutispora saccharofermentans]